MSLTYEDMMRTLRPTVSRPKRSRPFLLDDLDKPKEKLGFSTIRPQQLYISPMNLSTVCPEIALMHAVLADAINCLQKQGTTNGRDTQRLVREAEEWVFSDDLDWPFSFLNICAALGIDPGYLRRGLTRWRRQPQAARQKQGRSPMLKPEWLESAAS